MFDMMFDMDNLNWVPTVSLYNEPEIVQEVHSDPIEVRAAREEVLRSSEDWDERDPVTKLIDLLVGARLAKYSPYTPPNPRGDIICLCCGLLYRPDDITDGVNMVMCASCIATRKGR